MRIGKSQIIWITENGAGRVVNLNFNPALLRILGVLLVLCVAAIPFLEAGLFTMAEQVAELETKKQALQAEVKELAFLKTTLAQMEEKDRALREHFGMEAFSSLAMAGFGGGDGGDVLADETGPQTDTGGAGLGQRLRRVGDNARILGRLQMEQDLARTHTPSILPVSGDRVAISSRFGWRKNPFTERKEFHSGIDIVGARGARIIAPAAGTVVRNGYDDWLGHYMVIQHTGSLKTIYGHMEKATVRQGEAVARGQDIGLVGNSGMSTSRHLHYTVVADGRAVDPMQYVLNAEG